MQAEKAVQSKVKLSTFNPLLHTEDVKQDLQSHPVGTAHTCGNKLLVVVSEGVVQEIDISAIPSSFFLSQVCITFTWVTLQVKLGEVEGTVDNYLKRYTQLTKVSCYTVQVGGN